MRPFGRPFIHPPLWASQPGLRPRQPARPEAQTASQSPEEGMDGHMDIHTYIGKISLFYRTLSPIGAAVLPPSMKTKEKVEQGKGTADHLMPLGYFFLEHLMRVYSAALVVCV